MSDQAIQQVRSQNLLEHFPKVITTQVFAVASISTLAWKKGVVNLARAETCHAIYGQLPLCCVQDRA